MLYYRQKILLSLIEVFDRKLARTQLQKLTFLFTREQKERAFDFVPYHFGCYSFQAKQDLYSLARQGILEEKKDGETSYWVIKGDKRYKEELKKEDRELLDRVQRQFKDASPDELIAYTYIHYPYYASNSTIAHRYLSREQLEKVAAERPHFDDNMLFTIGYEGISLENFLNKLLLQDVKLLCDVRKNSFSMKYGFSKKELQHACEQVGIAFRHIPELGIDSDKRRNLHSQAEYHALFDEYECTTLVQNRPTLLQLAGLFPQFHRIAITCFEANHCLCHRGIVAKTLQSLPDWDIPVTHL